MQGQHYITAQQSQEGAKVCLRSIETIPRLEGLTLPLFDSPRKSVLTWLMAQTKADHVSANGEYPRYENS